MKYLDWNEQKNDKLKQERDICFEDIVEIVREDKILITIKNPNQKRYPDQSIFIVNINDYAYMVPYVEDENKYFLKTIIPSRKATKLYIIKVK
jgi:uncharacterized DUF497 family protein